MLSDCCHLSEGINDNSGVPAAMLSVPGPRGGLDIIPAFISKPGDEVKSQNITWTCREKHMESK